MSVGVESSGRAQAVSVIFEEPTGDELDRKTPVDVGAARFAAEGELQRLHERFDRCKAAGRLDEQWCTAAVLVQRGFASPEEEDVYLAHRSRSTPRPKRPLTVQGWDALFCPEEDRLTGDVFAVIAPAALLGRVAAMRADRTAPRLDPKQLQDPRRSTVSAVRALAWASATLGLQTPPIFVSPETDSGLEIVVHLPPASRIGMRMLSGQSAHQLAHHSARHLTWFREEHFVCTLVPTIEDLGELFIAALAIGAPELDLRADVRARASLIAKAIGPVLEPHQIERLRQLVARFISQGGRTDLQEWARAAGMTAARAGLLLSGDLETSCQLAAAEPHGAERVRELELFWSSDTATELRTQLGIALES